MKTRNRITFLLSNNYLGGPARVVSELGKELAIRGNEVIIGIPIVPYWQFYKRIRFKKLTLTKRLNLMLRMIFKNLYVEFRQNRFKWVFGIDKGLKVKRYLLRPGRRLLLKSEYIIISGNWYQIYDIDKSIAGRKRIFQFVYHFDNANDSSIDSLIINAYNLPSTKITISKNNAEELKNKGIKIDHIIHLGISREYFYPASSLERPLKILMFYDTEWRKGTDIGIQALRKIKLNFKDIDLCLISPTPVRDVPEGFSLKFSLSNQELGELYRSYPIFVYPALLGGFGFPPLEAMTCGCAVVTTRRVGAVDEYGINRESAVIVEPRNLDALVKGIELLLSDEKLRSNISRNAVIATSRLTWQRSADELESFLFVSSTNTQG